MRNIIARLLLTAFGLWVADALLANIVVERASTLWLAALLLGAVNIVVRPIIVLLTLPLTILTLGLFLLVINGAMLLLVARLIPSFHVEGLGAAVLGSIIMSISSWIAGAVLGTDGKTKADTKA